MRPFLSNAALSIVALVLVSSIAAGDDFKIIRLEQDVRNLEREVQSLSRQVNELRQSLSRSGEEAALSGRKPAPPPQDESPGWLSIANWDRLRTGDDELKVIDALGPPTSMRDENGSRVLLYAMEIGSSGFLSGSVTLKDRVVVEVRKPVLK
jgi:outer membrane murein-binding lipoprotein Lpp